MAPVETVEHWLQAVMLLDWRKGRTGRLRRRAPGAHDRRPLTRYQ
ncbi:hypothetical protein [Massilia eburnea]